MSLKVMNDRAFNLGSDARIGRRPISTNPYTPGTKENDYFRQGWFDVNRSWGKWTKGTARYLGSVIMAPRRGAA